MYRREDGVMIRKLSPLGAAALVLSQEYGFPAFPCAPRTKEPLVGKIRHDGARWTKGVDDASALACNGGFHRASTHAEQVCA